MVVERENRTSEDELAGQEVPAVRAKRPPNAPTAEERAQHLVSHLPYRSWCRSCVAGRGRSDPHFARGHRQDSLPVIAIDYAFLGRTEEASPILVMKDSGHRWPGGEVLPSKGVEHRYNAKPLVNFCLASGWPAFILRSDGEPSIVALKAEAARILKSEHGVKVISELSAKGDSQGNGLAENVAKEIKGMVRTLRHHVEEHHGITVGPSHMLLPWMVKHAGALLARGQKGADGRTAYELRKGRPFKRPLPAFGEKVLWLEPGKPKSRLTDRWLEGIFVGLHDDSDEILVATENGVLKARTAKRLSPEDGRDGPLVNRVVGLPWRAVPSMQEEGDDTIPAAAVRIEADKVVPEGDLPEKVEEKEPQARRVYIRRHTELKKYGFTSHCHGCQAAAARGRPQPHSETCRVRIEAEMCKDELRGRVVEAAKRRKVEMAEPAVSPAVEEVEHAVSPALEPRPREDDRPEAERPQKRRLVGKQSPPPAGSPAETVAAGSPDLGVDGAVSSAGSPAKMDIDEARELGCLARSLGACDVDADNMLNCSEPGLIVDWTGENCPRDEPGREVMRQVRWVKKPALLVMSTSCGAFETLVRMDRRQAAEEEVRGLVDEGLEHVHFVTTMAREQAKEGFHFVVECSPKVASWGVDLAKAVGGHVAVEGAAGTNWLTNSVKVAESLEGMTKDGGDRAGMGRFSAGVMKAIMAGAKKEMNIGLGIHALEIGQTMEESEPLDLYTGDEVKTCWDDVTGVALPPDAVKEADALELKFMKDLNVYEPATFEQAWSETGREPIDTGWVRINKGDGDRVAVRSRLVVKETRAKSTLAAEDVTTATFAATPPIEGLRLILSLAMTRLGYEDKIIGFVDISRAHPHATVGREVYVKAPPESEEYMRGLCWKLLRCLYGLRDAGARFDAKCEEVMVERLAFEQGKFSPCIYHQKMTGLVVWRHGDDFAAVGERRDVDAFKLDLANHLMVKDMGNLGPRRDLGDKSEMTILNRVVRWTTGASEAIEYEADGRHVEILLAQMKLGHEAKSVVTPGVKKDPGPEVELTGERREVYRGAVMRAAYLAQDRPELQFSVKELSRLVGAPTEEAWARLKRVARFLKGAPRTIARYVRQSPVGEVKVFTDSDHAGCVRTRKSTSSVVAMHGKHWLKSSSTTQQEQALSSGESEFYALVKGASLGIGLKTLMEDIGKEVLVILATDSTAGTGIAQRRGVGKVRHLATKTLWIQSAVARKLIKITRVPGVENPADLGTKHLDGKKMWQLLAAIGHEPRSGRSTLTLRAALGDGLSGYGPEAEES